MATVVYYNGVELHNVTTRQWDEELVYDASGTDLLFRRLHLRFQGLCHRSMTGETSQGDWGPAYITAPGVSGSSSTPEIFNIVRTRLTMPRQQLQVEMNGQSVLNVAFNNPSGSGVENFDLDGGPKPRVATLAHVAGDQVFRLDFAIDCCIDANNNPLDQAPLGGGTVIINNRWAIAESVGDNFAITRTIRGHLRLSHWVKNSQDFRTCVVPPLELSFKRERMDFQVSDNGLDCEYTIVDRQVHVAAPWPACKIEATYTESTNDGTAYWGDMAVALEGPVSAGVQVMMIRAMQIIDSRLRIQERGQNGQWRSYELVAASLTEHIGERNAIEAHVRVKHTLEPAQPGGVAKLYTQSFGQGQSGTELVLSLPSLPGLPNYDIWHSQNPEVFGYEPGTDQPRQAAFLFALGCYFQDPWHPQIMNSGLGDPSIVSGSPNPGPIVTVSSGLQTDLPPVGDKLSPETRSATYTFTRMDTRYVRNSCNVQLPVASSDRSNPSATTAAIVNLAPAQMRREIRFDSERVGAWPEIPGAEYTYSDGYGMQGCILTAWDRCLPPGLTADKTQTIYRIEGYRLYAMSRTGTVGEALRTGVLPHTNLTPQDNTVALDQLVTARMQA